MYNYSNGGLTAGRWYKDNTGSEFRFIGDSSSENGIGLFNDGERFIKKPYNDFEPNVKETKLFKWFKKGGEPTAAQIKAKSYRVASPLEIREKKKLDRALIKKEIKKIPKSEMKAIEAYMGNEDLLYPYSMAKGGKVSKDEIEVGDSVYIVYYMNTDGEAYDTPIYADSEKEAITKFQNDNPQKEVSYARKMNTRTEYDIFEEMREYKDGGQTKQTIQLEPIYTKRDKQGFRFYSTDDGNTLYAEKNGKIYNVSKDSLKVIGEVPLSHRRFEFVGLINDEDVKNLYPLHYEYKTLGKVKKSFGMAKGGDIDFGHDLGDGFSIGNDVHIIDPKSLFVHKTGYVSGLFGKDLLVTLIHNGNERNVVVSKKGVEKIHTPMANGGEIEIGDYVKIKENYGGGSGTVEDIVNNFVIVKTKDGNKSFHISDLQVIENEEDEYEYAKGGKINNLESIPVLYHYTNDSKPIISTIEERLIPNSLSTSANKKDWSWYGKNLFEITLPSTAKLMVVDNDKFFSYGKEVDTPLNRGKEMYKEAKKKKIDVIFLNKIMGTKNEYVILNDNFKYEKINRSYAKGGEVKVGDSIRLKKDLPYMASLSNLYGKNLKVDDVTETYFASGLKKFYHITHDGDKYEVNEDFVDNERMEHGGKTEDSVTFSIDKEELDEILHNTFESQLKYIDEAGDVLYSLPKRQFDRLIDIADSKGFDVDYENSEESVIIVYDNYAKGGQIALRDAKYTMSLAFDNAGFSKAFKDLKRLSNNVFLLQISSYIKDNDTLQKIVKEFNETLKSNFVVDKNSFKKTFNGNEIKIENKTSMADGGRIDEVGEFWVVEKPSKDASIDDILFKSRDVDYYANQIRGGLKEDNVVGLFRSEDKARKLAEKLLKNYKSMADGGETEYNLIFIEKSDEELKGMNDDELFEYLDAKAAYMKQYTRPLSAYKAKNFAANATAVQYQKEGTSKLDENFPSIEKINKQAEKDYEETLAKKSNKMDEGGKVNKIKYETKIKYQSNDGRYYNKEIYANGILIAEMSAKSERYSIPANLNYTNAIRTKHDYKINEKGIKTLLGEEIFKNIKFNSSNISYNNKNFYISNYGKLLIKVLKDFINYANDNDDKMAEGGEIAKKEFDISDDEASEDVYEWLMDNISEDIDISEDEDEQLRQSDIDEILSFFNNKLENHDIEIEEYYDFITLTIIKKMAKGGETKFKDKVKAIQKKLLANKKVPKSVQKDYGKTYNKEEAKESAQRIVGSIVKKEKMSKGGKTSVSPLKDRIYGSKKNKPGSASSKTSAKEIKLDDSIIETLSNKAKEYNKKHSSKVNTNTLKAVMRRGMGAYSSSHRATITGGAPNSRQAWGFARVNKFLLKKGGTKVKAAYVQDDDLLENGGELKKEMKVSDKPKFKKLIDLEERAKASMYKAKNYSKWNETIGNNFRRRWYKMASKLRGWEGEFIPKDVKSKPEWIKFTEEQGSVEDYNFGDVLA
jgi:hypothetical protein